MTQANNRRGAGWLGVGTFTAAEVNALSAVHGRGGGTESNRARAARGGFAWEPVGDPRPRPSDGAADHGMEAKIHAQALTLAHTTRCTYADARAHVEAMLAPRMERLDAGQVREVFERVAGVAIGREHVAVPVDPNATAAQMAQAVTRALGAPWEAERNVVRQSKQPTPAPGQVWLPPTGWMSRGWLAPDGTVEVVEVDGVSTYFRVCGHVAKVDHLGAGWTCIGVATPHGRVMVGDGFAALGEDEAAIVAIGAGDSVLLRARDGWEQWTNASGLTDGGSTQRRTRYAPARAGERFRAGGGYCDDWTIDAYDVGRVFDAAAYERLDPAQPSTRVYAAHKVSVNGRELRDVTEAHGLDAATGPDLDALAATMGIKRRAAVQPSGTATDAQGRELAFDYGGSIKGPPSVDYPYTLPDLANQARTLTLAPGSRLTPLGDGRAYRIEPEPERPSDDVEARVRTVVDHAAAELAKRDLALSVGADVWTINHPRCRSVLLVDDTTPPLTLQAPASQLRALFDAIGRALELPATRHACAFGEGLTVTVLRDEMLFTPTAQTGLGTAELAGDARALCALRACVATAMANGHATLPQWGTKVPRVEVRRVGGAAAVVAPEASEPPRYTPDAGGAGAWRWEV